MIEQRARPRRLRLLAGSALLLVAFACGRLKPNGLPSHSASGASGDSSQGGAAGTGAGRGGATDGGAGGETGGAAGTGAAGGEEGGFAGNGSEPPRVITTRSVPDALYNVAFRFTFAAQGGAGGRLRWSITDGGIPDGVDLDADGTLQGTPLQEGLFDFDVTVSEAGSTTSTSGHF